MCGLVCVRFCVWFSLCGLLCVVWFVWTFVCGLVCVDICARFVWALVCCLCAPCALVYDCVGSSFWVCVSDLVYAHAVP